MSHIRMFQEISRNRVIVMLLAATLGTGTALATEVSFQQGSGSYTGTVE